MKAAADSSKHKLPRACLHEEPRLLAHLLLLEDMALVGTKKTENASGRNVVLKTPCKLELPRKPHTSWLNGG